jgi:hypothetical protein
MATAIFVQGEDNNYGIEKGSIIWADEIEVSSVDDGEFIYFKFDDLGTFGIIVGDTVESKDDIYELSECRVYRLEDEEVKRVAKGTTANLNPLAYPHYENV